MSDLPLSHLNFMSVLIADDDPNLRRMIAKALLSAGLIDIFEAEDGNEALDKCQRFKPDLLILDLHMPGKTGYQVSEEIRKDPALCDIPIIVETGVESTKEKAMAFDLGATDLLTKPFAKQELVARVRVHLEARSALRDLSAFKERLSYELEVTQHQFSRFLSNSHDMATIEKKYGLKVAVHSRTSSEIGGDFWMVTPINDTCFGVLLIDMTGHGVSAAMNAARFQTLLTPFPKFEENGASLFNHLNARLFDLLPTGYFAAGIWLVFDTQQETVTMTAGASPDVLLAHPDKTVTFLDGSGLALATIKDEVYEHATHPFTKGQALLCYTDGLTDCQTASGQSISLNTVRNILQQAIAENSDAAVEVGTRFDATFHEAPDDDVTVISVRALPG